MKFLLFLRCAVRYRAIAAASGPSVSRPLRSCPARRRTETAKSKKAKIVLDLSRLWCCNNEDLSCQTGPLRVRRTQGIHHHDWLLRDNARRPDCRGRGVSGRTCGKDHGSKAPRQSSTASSACDERGHGSVRYVGRCPDV